MIRYAQPDTSQWPEGDARVLIDGFDPQAFREIYNERMPDEQPPLPQTDMGFSLLERVFVDTLGNHGGRILDVGCGNGRLLVMIAKEYGIYSGHGIDISDAMVENARQSAANNEVELTFERVAIEDFSPPHQYDGIVATELLEHIYSPCTFLATIMNWLRDDGIFCGSVPRDRTCDAVVHLHYFSLTSLERLLRNYFVHVTVNSVDVTGAGEVHLGFLCQHPKRETE